MMTETTTEKPISLTPAAVQEIKRLMSAETMDTGTYLRIGAKGGGCSGLSYILAFDKITDKDLIYQIDGIECIINPSHLIYLANMTVDWEGGLNSRGFVFQNPNASDNCGCGSSFAV